MKIDRLSEQILKSGDDQYTKNQNKENIKQSHNNQQQSKSKSNILSSMPSNMNMNMNMNMQDDCVADDNKEKIRNMRRANLHQIRQIQLDKCREIQAIKELFQKEKLTIVSKYQNLLKEKQEYIRVLEELYAKPQAHQLPSSHSTKLQLSETTPTITAQSHRNSKIASEYTIPQTYFLHQTALYNELCFSIQRPQNHKPSSLFLTQKMKNRVTSNEKKSVENSLKSSCSKAGSRSYSTQRWNGGQVSKHGLAPASQPRYAKIL